MFSLNPLVYTRNYTLSKALMKTFYNKFLSKLNNHHIPHNPFDSQNYRLIHGDLFLYKILIKSIQNKTPLMIARYGGCEHDVIANMLLYEAKIMKNFNYSYQRLCNNAGFFPNHLKTTQEIYPYVKKFFDIYQDASKQCDILGTWSGTLGFEQYLIDHMCKKNIKLAQILKLGPNIDEEFPFTYALKDSTVLVIHPFVDTIQSQYKNYDKLFKNKKVLPKFNLKTFRAVQTSGGETDSRFKDWFEALKWMTDEINKIEYDIALIGCGAYGFPLASQIKKQGKIAIHCGGVLQLLFGIKGKRWETEQASVGKKLFNNFWVYPNDKETIKNASKIEGGCYW